MIGEQPQVAAKYPSAQSPSDPAKKDGPHERKRNRAEETLGRPQREHISSVTETPQAVFSLPTTLQSEETEHASQVGRESVHCMKTDRAQAEKSV